MRNLSENKYTVKQRRNSTKTNTTAVDNAYTNSYTGPSKIFRKFLNKSCWCSSTGSFNDILRLCHFGDAVLMLCHLSDDILRLRHFGDDVLMLRYLSDDILRKPPSDLHLVGRLCTVYER